MTIGSALIIGIIIVALWHSRTNPEKTKAAPPVRKAVRKRPTAMTEMEMEELDGMFTDAGDNEEDYIIK